MGQTKMVLRALNHARNGFFVEAGALDGELRSNTLMLERQFGWNVINNYTKVNIIIYLSLNNNGELCRAY